MTAQSLSKRAILFFVIVGGLPWWLFSFFILYHLFVGSFSEEVFISFSVLSISFFLSLASFSLFYKKIKKNNGHNLWRGVILINVLIFFGFVYGAALVNTHLEFLGTATTVMVFYYFFIIIIGNYSAVRLSREIRKIHDGVAKSK